MYTSINLTLKKLNIVCRNSIDTFSVLSSPNYIPHIYHTK